MKYIAFLSFGKDSIAQLIKIKELGLPLDEVVYVDIRYTPEISGEHPIMAEWIPTAEKIIKEKLGITVKHLAAQYSFREYFYRKKEKGDHKGEIYGFPFVRGAWCNSRMKLDVIKKYENSLNDEITEYMSGLLLTKSEEWTTSSPVRRKSYINDPSSLNLKSRKKTRSIFAPRTTLYRRYTNRMRAAVVGFVSNNATFQFMTFGRITPTTSTT